MASSSKKNDLLGATQMLGGAGPNSGGITQSINLYQTSLQPAEGLRSFRALALLSACAFAVSLLWSMAEKTKISGLAADLEQQQSLLAARAGIEQNSLRQHQESLPAPALLRAVEAAEKEQQLLADQLGTLPTTLDRNYSDLLVGLSQSHEAGLWLTRIELSAGGSLIRLSGETMQAGKLPAFVARLGNESAFKGRYFRTMSVQPANHRGKASLASSGLKFTLNSLKEGRH